MNVLRNTRLGRTIRPNYRSIDRDDDVASGAGPGPKVEGTGICQFTTRSAPNLLYVPGFRGPRWPRWISTSSAVAPKTTKAKGIKAPVISSQTTTTPLTHLSRNTHSDYNEEIHDRFGCSSLCFYNRPRRTGGVQHQGCLGSTDPLSDRGDPMECWGNLHRHMGYRPETRASHQSHRDSLLVHGRDFGYRCVNVNLRRWTGSPQPYDFLFP